MAAFRLSLSLSSIAMIALLFPSLAGAQSIFVGGYGGTTLTTQSGGDLVVLAYCPDNAEAVELAYEGVLTGVTLRDDGLEGDLVKGDGLYSLIAPIGPSAGSAQVLLEIVASSDGKVQGPLFPYLPIGDVASPTPSVTPSPSATPTDTATIVPTETPTVEPSHTPTATASPIPTITPTPDPNSPLFWRDVYPITQMNCATCHTAGGIGPFTLTSYDDVASRAANIEAVILDGYMPPWLPDLNCQSFQDARVLASHEIQTISDWVANGAPEGNIADKVDVNNSFTNLGPPDVLLDIGVDFDPGTMHEAYRCFSLDPGLVQDMDLVAFQVNPGNKRIVHHVLMYTDDNDESEGLDNGEAGPGYTCFGGPKVDGSVIGGWAPGMPPFIFPAGIGYQLSAGKRIVVQVHYSPDGTPQTDRTTIGLYFSPTPMPRKAYVIPVLNTRFLIPAGDPWYKVTASMTVPPGFAGEVFCIGPHMHLLGQQISVELTRVNGAKECVIHIPYWDFHWQQIYCLDNPIVVAPGDRVEITAYYDNSSNNPDNPNNPPIDVGWGDRTTDEMCITYFYAAP